MDSPARPRTQWKPQIHIPECLKKPVPQGCISDKDGWMDVELLQTDADRLIGVTEDTVNSWDNSTANPPVSVYPEIYKFLAYVPYDPAMPLSERLKCWRRSLGMSQREFGKLAGFDPSTIMRWEGGKMMPGKDALSRLRVALLS